MAKSQKGKKARSKSSTRPTRIKKSGHIPSDAESEAIINTIAEKVASGKCILFLGAGVHYPPPKESTYKYPEKDRPPLASKLSESLAAKTGFAKRFKGESSTNLQRVAQDYETKFQRSELVREIKSAVFAEKKPSPVLRALASLDFPVVVTTNYDQLFEEALRSAGKVPRISVYKKNEDLIERTDDLRYGEELTSKHPFVFKFHGDIDHPESIVITDEDYIQFILRMGDKQAFYPVPQTVQYYFVQWPTLFIGYSLKDYNLRLLFKTLRWRIDKAELPPTYSVDLYPDPLILDVWQNQRKYVNFVVTDVWTFVPELYRIIMGKEMPK